MAFKDYSELADPLQLPIGGKLYTIPELSIGDSQTVADLFTSIREGTPVPVPDETLGRMLLGDSYDEMVADDIPGPALMRATLAAVAFHQGGREVAEMLWETGGDLNRISDKIARSKPQDRKAKAK